MEASKKSGKALAEIRDHERLGYLRRRPRCHDGTLDMRCRANQGLEKHAAVTNFYDPAEPSVVIKEAAIQKLLSKQQEQYDKARFEELVARVKKLERERSSLLHYKEKAQ